MNNKSPKEKKGKSKSIKKSKANDKENQKEKPNPKADKKEKKEKKHRAKKEKREGEPKKPMSAYLLFCADKRAENKDKKLSAKELGQMYGDLPDNKKDEYKKRYEDAVKKYEKELAAFNEKNTESEEESEPKKENKKKKAKTSKADQKKK